MGIVEERKIRREREGANTPGWIHYCEQVRHQVWTVRGASCAFCGTRLR